MRLLRVLVWWFGLMLALAPLSAAFASTASDHAQEEVVNAEAELQAAQQEAADFAAQAAQDAANARAIAFLKSETLRELQLTNTANATAVQQLASGLADAIRSQGDAKARNEMAILQIKANALIVKADGRLTNALAIGRADEIANAQAQSEALHQVADYLTGALAQQNMTNAEVIAEHDAAALEVSAMVEAQNADAMGADELFAADSILEGASLDVTSAMIAGDAQGEAIVAHALVELANAEAIAALTAP
jgi:hypothetical protein